MNLADFVVDGIYDDFVGSVFGREGQLVVKARLTKTSPAIKYLVHCAICSVDVELFGQGYFSITKFQLKEEKYPCGCSPLPKWTKEQTLLRINRLLSGSNYKFVSIESEWNATRTRIICSCDIHGEQPSQTIMDVLTGRKCRECRVDRLSKANTIPDKVHIENFMNTGAYHPETKFWRSDKKTPHSKYRNGFSAHWWIRCGACNVTVETLYVTLKKGGLSCECSSYNQKFSYIHLIKDYELQIGLKFGISNDVHRRFMGQQNMTSLVMENIGVWEFDNSINCKKAERILKNTMDCGVISKELFPDGHSETTHINNIDNIIKVYEEYGGIRL